MTDLINDSPNAPRILRDVAKIISLIKAVAIIRHEHRMVDRTGRIVAEIEDYAVIHELVEGMYQATVTNVEQSLRDVVQAVSDLNNVSIQATVTRVAEHLSWNKMTADRWINKAIANGWLRNISESKSAFDLWTALPLPEEAGLPHPDKVRQRFADIKPSRGRAVSKRV